MDCISFRLKSVTLLLATASLIFPAAASAQFFVKPTQQNPDLPMTPQQPQQANGNPNEQINGKGAYTQDDGARKLLMELIGEANRVVDAAMNTGATYSKYCDAGSEWACPLTAMAYTDAQEAIAVRSHAQRLVGQMTPNGADAEGMRVAFARLGNEEMNTARNKVEAIVARGYTIDRETLRVVTPTGRVVQPKASRKGASTKLTSMARGLTTQGLAKKPEVAGVPGIGGPNSGGRNGSTVGNLGNAKNVRGQKGSNGQGIEAKGGKLGAGDELKAGSDPNGGKSLFVGLVGKDAKGGKDGKGGKGALAGRGSQGAFGKNGRGKGGPGDPENTSGRGLASGQYADGNGYGPGGNKKGKGRKGALNASEGINIASLDIFAIINLKYVDQKKKDAFFKHKMLAPMTLRKE